METLAAQAEAVEGYIRGKDENRPFLALKAFDEHASLSIAVLSEGISLAPSADGREAIVEILVRDFARDYENVRTLCLSAPPGAGDVEFACPWLVGMSSKNDGTVRVGCGHYLWGFASQAPRCVVRFKITIHVMTVLAREHLPVVTAWLFSLPYPWCSPLNAVETAPALRELDAVRKWIQRQIA